MNPDHFGRNDDRGRQIARGEDSEILLASSSRRTSPGTPRWVALKRLRPDRLKDEESRAALVDEINFARVLAHPRLPRFCGGDTRSRTPWLAQEYTDGPDLATLLLELGKRGRRLDLRCAWQVMRAVAEALDYLHRTAWRVVPGTPAGSVLVHGDVVTDNVLVSAQGSVQLTDFGRVWFVGSDREPPAATRGFTPALTPEQARGQSVDARSDVFLFGALFYECLTGRHPFLRDTVHETAREVGRARPVALETLRPVPPEVAALVERCLDVSPARRPPTTAALIEALDELDLPGIEEGQVVLAEEIASVFPGHQASTRPWVLRGGTFRPPFLPMVLSWLPPPASGPDSSSPTLAPAEGGPARLGPDTARGPDLDAQATDSVPQLVEEAVPEAPVPPPVPQEPGDGPDPLEIASTQPRRGRRHKAVQLEEEPARPAPPARPPIGVWVRGGLAGALGAGLTALAFLLFVPRTPDHRPPPAPVQVGPEPARAERRASVGPKAAPLADPVGASVQVVIHSAPPGARVSVDGQDLGLAPVTLDRTPGALLQVQLELDRHASTSRLVPVPDEGGEFTIRLEPGR